MKTLNQFLLSLILATALHAQHGSHAVDEAKSATEELASFTVPEGFVVELVASEDNGLINPIDLTFDDAGRLWTQTALMYPLDAVGDMAWNDLMNLMENPELKANYPEFERIRKYYTLETPGTDKLLVIDNPTKNVEGDIRVFADGLTIPQSILPYKTGAFIAHGSEMLFLDDTDLDGKSDSHKMILTGFGFNDTHTMSHSLVRGPGGWVHFSQGALNEGEVTAVASGESTQIAYSKIAKFSLDGRKIAVTNTAGNNMWGFQLRETGQWYASEANDRGYCVTPLDPFMAVPGIGNKNQRDYQPWTPRIHRFGVGGTGISGLAFDENGSKGFPEEWNNIAFIANPLTNAINAVFIERYADGSVKSEHREDFLTSTDKWFRPVNIEFGPDGCLYIADWYNKIIAHNETPRSDPRRDRKHGRIWRIRHESQVQGEIPNLTKVSNTDLIDHLSAEILWEKRAAWQQIADRQASELIPELVELVKSTDSSIPARVHALWSLESLGHFDYALMKQLLADSHHDIRTQTLRALVNLKVSPEQLGELISPLIDDEHYMVRAQLILTIDEANVCNQQLMSLLVTASKPELEGNALGGSFERRFERFLARKAMEKYPNELVAYFNSDQIKSQPLSNKLWALLALPATEKEPQFLKLWDSIKQQEIEDETFIAIMSMIDSPAVYQAVTPHFLSDASWRAFLDRANRLVSKLKQPQKDLHRYAIDVPMVFPEALLSMLSEPLLKLYDSGEESDRDTSMEIANTFRSSALNDRIRRDYMKVDPNNETYLKRGLEMLSRNPEEYSPFVADISSNSAFDEDLRIKAFAKIFRQAGIEKEKVNGLFAEFFHGKSEDDLKKKSQKLSQSLQGLMIMLRLYETGKIDDAWFDRVTTTVLRREMRRNEVVKKLAHEVFLRDRKQQASYKAKIQKYGEAVKTLKGNPAVGQGLFQMCLTCHQVAGQGQEIAPPLDGSSTRDNESLLTAIVHPDAAIEAGYLLYCVVDIDGRIIPGYLYKKDEWGTTVAQMGGAKIFTAQSDIKFELPVPGKSFMPSTFSEFTDQMMADLVSYIKTLK